MFSDRSWWSLPGPHRLLRELDAELGSGRSAFVGFPLGAPSGFREAFQAHLRSRSFLCLQAEHVEEPLVFLRENVPVGKGADLSGLAMDLDEVVVWVEGIPPDAVGAWSKQLEVLCDALKERDELDRGTIVCELRGVSASDLPGADTLIAVLRYAGRVDEIDQAIWITDHLPSRSMSRIEKKLRVSIASHVAGYDGHLSSELCQLDFEALFDPHDHVLASSSCGKDCRPNWENGGSDDYDGEWFEHPRLLLERPSGRLALQQRVWKGQVAVLFPYLESRRQRLIDKYEGSLRVPHETKYGVIEDRRDLELVHICKQLRSKIPDEQRRRISLLVDIRNTLAHMELVSAEDVRDVMRWGGVLAE